MWEVVLVILEGKGAFGFWGGREHFTSNVDEIIMIAGRLS